MPHVFVAEVRPSLEWETLIETMYSLAADGKTSKKGSRTRSASQ